MYCQGFKPFVGFLHHFVLAKLATRSVRVKLFMTESYVIFKTSYVQITLVVEISRHERVNPFMLIVLFDRCHLKL